MASVGPFYARLRPPAPAIRIQVHPLLCQTPVGSFRSGWLVPVEFCKYAPRHLCVEVENAIRRSLNSCKAAVVCAGLAALAARGARGRAGAGHKVRPAGPTNWPAWRASGRPGRPVGRTAKERGLYRSGGKGRATGRVGPFHCRGRRTAAGNQGNIWPRGGGRCKEAGLA